MAAISAVMVIGVGARLLEWVTGYFGIPLNVFIPLGRPMDLIISLIVAPMVEELFFRGILFNSLKNEFPIWLAIIMGGVIFMGIHLHFHVGALALGLITCTLFYLTNSIIPGIFLHIAGNAMMWLVPNYYF